MTIISDATCGQVPRRSAGRRAGAWMLASTLLVCAPVAQAQEAADLAKKLANPISSLISVPFQLNYDSNIGPADDGERLVLNIQPVIPTSLNSDWNLITRVILPMTSQEDIFPGAGDQFGLGDTTISAFFSPVKPAFGRWIWGVGPVAVLPTATDDLLGGEKWALGPTAIALTQSGPWTVGGLVNHVWSFAGDGKRTDINNTFLQPFVSYTTPKAWTYTLNTESSYDWKADEWSVPINAQVSKLTKFGNQPVSIGVGARYWANSSPTGPEGFGLRAFITFLYPKG
ncbi:hypothetical protein ACSSV4_004540 [Roseovarius sp. MBR-154]|jgi:hypothetical protein